MTMVLSRDAILSVPRSLPVPLEVPEWHGLIYIRRLSPAEKSAFVAWLRDGGSKPRSDRLEAHDERLCILAVVDHHGHPLFKDSDLDALREKNRLLGGTARVAEAICKLAGMAPANPVPPPPSVSPETLAVNG
jgi:hypothetical protein